MRSCTSMPTAAMASACVRAARARDGRVAARTGCGSGACSRRLRVNEVQIHVAHLAFDKASRLIQRACGGVARVDREDQLHGTRVVRGMQGAARGGMREAFAPMFGHNAE